MPKLVNFAIRLMGMVQIRQGFDSPDLSKCTGSHTPYLAVGIVLQSIQERRCRTHIAVIVQTPADHPADDWRRVMNPANDRVACFPTIQHSQSLDCLSPFFFVRKLQTGFKMGKHFALVTRDQRTSGIAEILRIRNGMSPGIAKPLDLA